MLGISEIKNKLLQAFNEQQVSALIEIIAMVYEQMMKMVDMDEVRLAIKDLADAQRRTEESLIAFKIVTEENFRRVWESINQLAEAQRRTEERLDAFEKATEENFKRVWESINQLTEAQRRTEERLNQLTIRVDQLAEAQRKTEERLDQLAEAQRKTEERLDQLAVRMDQLAEAQRKTEERLNQLAIRVDQLAEAQRRTEERLNQLAIRVDQLAEAQRKTEERLDKLAEAQTRLEEAVAILLGRMKTLEERVDWVFHSIGFAIEDKSLRVLPELLKKDGIEVEGRLVRKYYWIKDDYNQINIFGWGRKNGSKILILGEVKMRASKKEIDKFLKLAREIQKREGEPPVLLIFVASDFHPKVEEYLQDKGIKYFWSFELD
ncbi:hypothetical protein JGI2_01099 [Candidatus Kryptobacter tengchongensis]|nr:hypothetical protein JGI2_01099 [Candidatus Kryptobacter tengchongensis]